MRRVVFAVDDVEDTVARVHRHGAELAGEITRFGVIRSAAPRSPGGHHRPLAGQPR
ncbi:hypothetical protein ACIRPX_38015 [Streptomyces sp. NPDC101225]|uniref:hypothetical protein n=1 Tax=Streptomyces sp. NPDC101225 TaxID=3366135 RepID=UPI00380A492F